MHDVRHISAFCFVGTIGGDGPSSSPLSTSSPSRTKDEVLFVEEEEAGKHETNDKPSSAGATFMALSGSSPSRNNDPSSSNSSSSPPSPNLTVPPPTPQQQCCCYCSFSVDRTTVIHSTQIVLWRPRGEGRRCGGTLLDSRRPSDAGAGGGGGGGYGYLIARIVPHPHRLSADQCYTACPVVVLSRFPLPYGNDDAVHQKRPARQEDEVNITNDVPVPDREKRKKKKKKNSEMENRMAAQMERGPGHGPGDHHHDAVDGHGDGDHHEVQEEDEWLVLPLRTPMIPPRWRVEGGSTVWMAVATEETLPQVQQALYRNSSLSGGSAAVAGGGPSSSVPFHPSCPSSSSSYSAPFFPAHPTSSTATTSITSSAGNARRVTDPITDPLHSSLAGTAPAGAQGLWPQEGALPSSPTTTSASRSDPAPSSGVERDARSVSDPHAAAAAAAAEFCMPTVHQITIRLHGKHIGPPFSLDRGAEPLRRPLLIRRWYELKPTVRRGTTVGRYRRGAFTSSSRSSLAPASPPVSRSVTSPRHWKKTGAERKGRGRRPPRHSSQHSLRDGLGDEETEEEEDDDDDDDEEESDWLQEDDQDDDDEEEEEDELPELSKNRNHHHHHHHTRKSSATAPPSSSRALSRAGWSAATTRRGGRLSSSHSTSSGLEPGETREAVAVSSNGRFIHWADGTTGLLSEVRPYSRFLVLRLRPPALRQRQRPQARREKRAKAENSSCDGVVAVVRAAPCERAAIMGYLPPGAVVEAIGHHVVESDALLPPALWPWCAMGCIAEAEAAEEEALTLAIQNSTTATSTDLEDVDLPTHHGVHHKECEGHTYALIYRLSPPSSSSSSSSSLLRSHGITAKPVAGCSGCDGGKVYATESSTRQVWGWIKVGSSTTFSSAAAAAAVAAPSHIDAASALTRESNTKTGERDKALLPKASSGQSVSKPRADESVGRIEGMGRDRDKREAVWTVKDVSWYDVTHGCRLEYIPLRGEQQQQQQAEEEGVDEDEGEDLAMIRSAPHWFTPVSTEHGVRIRSLPSLQRHSAILGVLAPNEVKEAIARIEIYPPPTASSAGSLFCSSAAASMASNATTSWRKTFLEWADENDGTHSRHQWRDAEAADVEEDEDEDEDEEFDGEGMGGYSLLSKDTTDDHPQEDPDSTTTGVIDVGRKRERERASASASAAVMVGIQSGSNPNPNGRHAPAAVFLQELKDVQWKRIPAPTTLVSRGKKELSTTPTTAGSSSLESSGLLEPSSFTPPNTQRRRYEHEY